MYRRAQQRGECMRKRTAASERARLAELKRAIQHGEYETPEKLDEALRNLLGALRSVRVKGSLSRAGESGGERP